MDAAASHSVSPASPPLEEDARDPVRRTVGLHGFEDHARLDGSAESLIQPRMPKSPSAGATGPAGEFALSIVERLTLAFEISWRYHLRRKAHYDGVYKYLLCGIALLSLAAFLLDLGNKGLVGMAVIGLGSLKILWNCGPPAREHDMLAQQYRQLLDDVRMTHKPTMNHVAQWRIQRMTLQSQEPPVYEAVMNECAYDVAQAWDLDPQKNDYPPLLRPFMHWVRF